MFFLFGNINEELEDLLLSGYNITKSLFDTYTSPEVYHEFIFRH